MFYTIHRMKNRYGNLFIQSQSPNDLLSRTREKHFIQSEISCQNESVSLQRVQVGVQAGFSSNVNWFLKQGKYPLRIIGDKVFDQPREFMQQTRRKLLKENKAKEIKNKGI